MEATPGVRQDFAPSQWREHRFGLPVDRWQALGGQCVWVTGGGTGFGRSIAGALAAAGACVVISSRRHHKLLEAIEATRELGIDTSAMLPLPVDITDPQAVEQAAAIIMQKFGGLRGLVHCAALPQLTDASPLMDMSDEQWDRLLRTNVTGAWLVARAAVRLMQSSGGRVVLLTSEAGWADTPGFGPYNISKSALNALGTSLAAECAARFPGADLQVNVLVPGEARTEMNQGSTESPWSIVGMTLLLLSHPAGGPNGHFFHRDGRHLRFGYAQPYERSLLEAQGARAHRARWSGTWMARLILGSSPRRP